MFLLIVFALIIGPRICECGRYNRVITTLKYSKNRVKLAVVNGIPANYWKVPYLVSIKEPFTGNKQLNSKANKLWLHLCGGSIITAYGHILTAAHCFEEDDYFYSKHPYILRAVAGSTETDIVHSGISITSPSGIQWRKPIKAYLHPEFYFPLNDIALVHLDHTWSWDSGLKPIGLTKQTTDELESCYTAGYGRVGHQEWAPLSPVLLMAPMKIIPRHLCTKVWEMNMDKFVCTSSAYTDVAEGDSGSPLACHVDAAGYSLAGVVSGKNFDTTTIFTRVSAFRDWINETSLLSGSAKHSTLRLTSAINILYVITIFCVG